MLEAAIFDLDGIIIDSEHLWREAEIKVFNTVSVHLTPEMCRKTTGMDTQTTIQYWYDRFPWEGKSLFQVYKELIEEVHPILEEKAELKDGFLDILQFFKESGVTVAVTSCTQLKIITNILKKFHLFDFFKIIHSSENDEYGKPHPEVYIKTAKKLNLQENHCLAFEDSFYGAIAAKAAKMKVVAVPDPIDFEGNRFDFVDLKLPSLKDFRPKHFNLLSSL